jgi:hypothetical protein
MKNTSHFVYQLIFLFCCTFFKMTSLYAQDFSKHSITAGFGFGGAASFKGSGIGAVYHLGYQKTFPENQRLRFASDATIGKFKTPRGLTDTRHQHFGFVNINAGAHFDVLKVKSFSVVTGAGGFINYSQGILEAGSSDNGKIYQNESFREFHGGALISLGFRVNKPNGRIGYEIRPLNAYFGLNYLMIYSDFMLAFRFRKS